MTFFFSWNWFVFSDTLSPLDALSDSKIPDNEGKTYLLQKQNYSIWITYFMKMILRYSLYLIEIKEDADDKVYDDEQEGNKYRVK